MSTSKSKCPLCVRSFGLILWKHTCQICKRTVCDDCAPKMSQTDNHGKKIRVCSECYDSMNISKFTSKYTSKSSNSATFEGNHKNNSVHEKQAEAVGEKNHSTHVGKSNSNSTLAASGHPSKSSINYLGTITSPRSECNVNNPVLEAALRRQKGNSLNNERKIGDEKMNLIYEIETLCESKGETAPFGLRASDEVKLRSYLKYLKGKYKF
ncbi:unnamed protein product [Phytomonas sp. Hart1]|nr:unnamed protein product [Phytomonas sp. Hart1]|eukprot:CCW66925.1 unnamed protein product [Phytomonas sp. isolate Hart1]